MYSVICHYGVKGQKWGVRRYQNPDGTRTELGKRIRNANRSENDVEVVYSSLSSKSKKMLGVNNPNQKYSDSDESSQLAKRFVLKDKHKKPVAFLDIDVYQENLNQYQKVGEKWIESNVYNPQRFGNVVIAVAENEHGKGYGTKIAKKGTDWLKKHEDEWTNVEWNAYELNKVSQHLAEKSGFKFIQAYDTTYGFAGHEEATKDYSYLLFDKKHKLNDVSKIVDPEKAKY